MTCREKLKPCPHCGRSGKDILRVRVMFSGSIFDKHLYFMECPSCHWCGKTKLFLWRAIHAWNKEKRK